MSKLSFRARALDASKPMPIYIAEDLPDLPDYSAINRAVPQMPSGMEKEEECEHHLQRAICTGLIIPTPEVCEVNDLEFYERCYPPDYKMPKQHIHMQPLWQEHETPEYDIDSEDERWLKQQRHPELTELKFEQMMDKLEKSSGQTVVTLNEAKLLLERNDDLVIAVYDYWLNKRLKTQHPLVLSVKTENRPGQSSNNPYLAFRRRTEKMQTRKNRKNDESSYEKMLKLRRDLAHALSVLEMVARREQLKRDFVLLTALVAEKRYSLGDFANHLLPDIPPRLQYSNVPLSAPPSFRREQYTVQNFPPRAPPAPVDQPRQREKRPYKRRKHRHHTAGSQALRDSGVCTSSEEEGSSRAEALSSPDDGLYTFRRKAGCYYEMPTSTLCGDPVDPDDSSKEGLYQHEIDERHRYTLTSLRLPYARCVGFARRRMTRGGRVALDRRCTPLDDLWPRLTFTFPGSQRHRAERAEEVELETKPHRTPKVLSRDYHSGGKHPWRHAFRQHLATNYPLWTDESECSTAQTMDVDIPQDSVKSDISVNARTVDSVSDNLRRVMRERAWSGCSDSSYDSDSSLAPVEKEFSHMMDEVNNEWLHFRPKTPLSSPARPESPHDGRLPLAADTKFAVELRPAEKPPTADMDTFTTAEFSLAEIYPDIPDMDRTGSTLDVSGDDLLTDNFTGLTEAQVESILSEADLKALADVDLGREERKPLPEVLLEELSESFLSQGQGLEGVRAGSGGRRGREAFGSSTVTVAADKEPIYLDVEAKKEVVKETKPLPQPVPTLKIVVEDVKDAVPVKVERKRSREVVESQSTIHNAQSTVHVAQPTVHSNQPTAHGAQATVLGVQSTVHGALTTVHGAQSTVQNVQIKTVHAKQSALKKHIITSNARRLTDLKEAQPQIVTVAVPADTLKVRLQNHLSSSQASVVASSSSTSAATVAGSGNVVGLVQNGPFTTAGGVAVALPIQHHAREQAAGVTSVTTSGAGVPGAASATSAAGATSTAGATGVPRRATPLIQLAPALTRQQLHLSPPVVVAPHQLHTHNHNKLKVLQGTPLTPTQRTQLLQGRTGISHLPTVVSLATLEAKTANNAALLKTASGNVTQFFEIKSGQLGKGPHLVNVVRQPQPGKTTVARLDLNDAKKRQVVFDGAALKGNIAAARPHRVSLNLDGRQIVRTAIPSVRAPQMRQQLQFKNRTLQVAAPIARSASEASTSITIAAPTKTTSLPTSVVNLLQKNVQLPKKIAISAPGGSPMAANLQAIAFTQAQLKARQARLITQPRVQPVAEIVEATTAPVPASSSSAITDTPIEVTDEESTTNGTVRRRTADTLPMEVT